MLQIDRFWTFPDEGLINNSKSNLVNVFLSLKSLNCLKCLGLGLGKLCDLSRAAFIRQHLHFDQ